MRATKLHSVLLGLKIFYSLKVLGKQENYQVPFDIIMVLTFHHLYHFVLFLLDLSECLQLDEQPWYHEKKKSLKMQAKKSWGVL